MLTCQENSLWQAAGTILENVRLLETTYKIRIKTETPQAPVGFGRFAMLRLESGSDPLLGRPLAFYRSGPETFEFVYAVLGKMTSRLAGLSPGERLRVWGTLGNGFEIPDTSTEILCIAGGIGFTPFLEFAESCIGNGNKITLLYGARSKNVICCMDDFRDLGVDVKIATEDGSEGTKGLVTGLIPATLGPGCKILACGPHPMLHAVYKAAKTRGVPCEVSLESPMACGLGICYSCVVEFRNDEGEWDYRRTCIDGPVFDAYRLKW